MTSHVWQQNLPIFEACGGFEVCTCEDSATLLCSVSTSASTSPVNQIDSQSSDQANGLFKLFSSSTLTFTLILTFDVDGF